MICDRCRDGGWLNRQANAAGKSVGIRLLAQKEHRHCKGGTQCDCQHYVGEAINKQLVKQ